MARTSSPTKALSARRRSIIKALVHTALNNKKGPQAAQVKAYAQEEAFEEIRVALEMTTAELSTNTQGQHFDLADVFDRVNAAYFDGALPRPRLTWNRTLTHRKFGHYQTTTDTVMVSLSLDDAQRARLRGGFRDVPRTAAQAVGRQSGQRAALRAHAGLPRSGARVQTLR